MQVITYTRSYLLNVHRANQRKKKPAERNVLRRPLASGHRIPLKL